MLTLLTIALLGIQPAPLAQGQQAASSAVTLALVEELPKPGALAVVVIKRSTQNRRDVILVRSDATPVVLAGALATYRRVRSGSQDTEIVLSRMRGRPRHSRDLAWSQSILVQLRNAEPKQVNGVGNARALDVVVR